MTTGWRLLLVAAVAMGLIPAAAAGQEPESALGDGTGRLFVFSVPGMSWADLERLELPSLETFAADGAIADLVPRSVVHRSDPGDAYLTISAGTRSVGVEAVDGEVLRTTETLGDETVGQVFERRTGEVVRDSSVVLGWPELVRRNNDEPYDAELGLLADTLDEAGIDTMVVGNADGTDEGGEPTVGTMQRQVGLALADGRGVAANGELGTDLLTVDGARPYGLRFDPTRVVSAFTDGWNDSDRLVAIVEASDLVRTMRYEPLVSADRYTELRDQALRETDELFAELLSNIDPATDAVLVLAPYNQNRKLGLTVAALQTPDGTQGYLRTASTQRAGIVSLVDVAPAILDLFDVDAPDAMEGRPFEVVGSSASFAERVDHLVSLNAASRFREHLLTPTTIAIVLALVALTAAAVAVLAGQWSEPARAAVRFGALVILAALPVSYLARAFPLEDLGLGFYWVFLVLGSLGVAVAATALTNRTKRPRAGLVAVLVLMLGVLLLDVMTGSNLSLDAAFGYSPTGNSRLYGISNYAFGQVATAACLLAAFLAATWPSRRGRWTAVGVLVGVLVVLGVPTWGSDVGGVLAFTPAVLVFTALLFHYRIRLRAVVIAGLATIAAITAFGFLDLSRPAEQRAHLGRLFERIEREGLEPLMSIVERKLFANLRVSTSSFWVLAIPIGILFWVFLSRHRSQALDGIRGRLPTLQAGLAAAAAAALLGSLVNDSGAIVGGVALTVVAASLAYLATEESTPAEVQR